MSEYAELLKFLTDPEATGLHNDAAAAIAKLEAERDALREALAKAADEFDLILMRLRDGQPARAEGAAICGAKDARALLPTHPPAGN